jgi:hypothetical protein
MICRCGANPDGLCGDCWLAPEQTDNPAKPSGLPVGYQWQPSGNPTASQLQLPFD